MKRQITENISQNKKIKLNVDERNYIEEVSVNIKKISYLTYFKYETINAEKVAVCLLCERFSLNKIIKRKNGNTTGVKHHLKTHPAEYKTMFPSEFKAELKGQKTLDHSLYISRLLFDYTFSRIIIMNFGTEKINEFTVFRITLEMRDFSYKLYA